MRGARACGVETGVGSGFGSEGSVDVGVQDRGRHRPVRWQKLNKPSLHEAQRCSEPAQLVTVTIRDLDWLLNIDSGYKSRFETYQRDR